MIKAKELKFERAMYHRNGISGDGFHVVEFSHRQGKQWLELRGIVFDDPGLCAVIDPADPMSKWRGDDFDPHLRAYITKRNAGTTP